MSTSLPPSLYSLQLLSYPFLPTFNRSSRFDGLWLSLFSHLLKYVWYMCVYDFSTDRFVLNSQLEISSLREVNYLSFSTHKSPVVLLLGMCLQKRLPVYMLVCLFLLVLHRSCLGSPNVELSRTWILYPMRRHSLISDCLIFLISTFYLLCIVSWALGSGVGLK